MLTPDNLSAADGDVPLVGSKKLTRAAGTAPDTAPGMAPVPGPERDEIRARQWADFARFVKRAGIFVVANLVVIAIVVTVAARIGQTRRERQDFSGSAVIDAPTDEHVDVLILGPSHARSMSWDGNHEILEAAIGGEVVTLAAEGGGPFVEDIFLDYFYAQGNTADTVVYFAHPFTFFSDKFNENRKFVADEPLDLDFARTMLAHGVASADIALYLQSKTAQSWLIPPRFGTAHVEVDEIDPTEYAAGLRRLYPDGTDAAVFDRYAAIFAQTIERALEHGSRVVIVIPPTLYDSVPGSDIAFPVFEEFAGQDGVEFVDLSGTITDPSLFGDLSHLNRSGVVEFLDLLTPHLDSTATE